MDERGRFGSAAIVGKPVALVTVLNVTFETRGFDACKKKEVIEWTMTVNRKERTASGIILKCPVYG